MMEFKDSLLQNEIKHLNNNFSLFSVELIILQEFLEQEFGTKFKAFLNARREQQLLQQSVSSTRNSKQSKVAFSVSSKPQSSSSILTSKTRTPRKYRGSIVESAGAHTKTDVASEEEDNEDDADEEEPYIIHDDDLDNSDSNSVEFGNATVESDENSHDSDSSDKQETKPNLHPLSLADLMATDPEPGKPGRRRSIIHRYFEKIQTEDGKYKDKCFTCGNIVSSKAPRLRNHIMKCRGESGNIEKLKKILNASKNNRNKDVLNNSNKIGRKFDNVRMVFKEHKTVEGNVKMQCLSCDQLVSNKACRMKKHLEKCSGEKGHKIVFDTNEQQDVREKSSVSASKSSSLTNENDTVEESTSTKSVYPIRSHGSSDITSLITQPPQLSLISVDECKWSEPTTSSFSDT